MPRDEMEPTDDYYRRHSGDQEGFSNPMDQLPWWLKSPWLIAMSVGPSAATGILLTVVFLGWIPSPMLDAITQSNQQYIDMKSLYTEVSKTQNSMAETQKAIAAAAAAKDARMEGLQSKIDGLTKGNRMQCRSMAKLLKNPDMNDKCDEL